MNKRELDNLMRNVQSGDENSFARLYEETYKGVFSFIYSIINDYYTSEDLMQDTFIKIRRNAQSYIPGTNVIAWIFQIAKNLTLDYIKSNKKVSLSPIDNHIIPVESNTDRLNDKIFYNKLITETLSKEEIQIVSLHMVSGFKNREIAKLLNMPIGTVLWKYNQAMKKLKNKLKEEQYEK